MKVWRERWVRWDISPSSSRKNRPTLLDPDEPASDSALRSLSADESEHISRSEDEQAGYKPTDRSSATRSRSEVAVPSAFSRRRSDGVLSHTDFAKIADPTCRLFWCHTLHRPPLIACSRKESRFCAWIRFAHLAVPSFTIQQKSLAGFPGEIDAWRISPSVRGCSARGAEKFAKMLDTIGCSARLFDHCETSRKM